MKKSLRSLGLHTEDLWVLATIEDLPGRALSQVSASLWRRFTVRMDSVRLRVVIGRLKQANLVSCRTTHTQRGTDWNPSLTKAGESLLHSIRWPSV